ncbi:MAG: hypothetical protein KAJ19_11730, partial [Gammaproteobacteria bacterium]|nr:hypothetical protein [Gammaproteobacteria bacterium]
MATLLLNQGGPPNGADAIELQFGDARNDASNVGAGGVGIVADPSSAGLELRFKSINSGSPGIVISDDETNSEVDILLDLAAIDHNQLLNAVGTISHDVIDLRLPTADQKSAMDAANLPAAGNPFATISDLVGTVVTGAANIGTSGFGVFSGATGTTLEFFNVDAVSPIIASLASDNITLSLDESAVVHQNLSGAGALTHAQIDARTPSVNQKSALDAASAPTGANPFATISDITDDQVAVQSGDSSGYLDDKIDAGAGLTKTVSAGPSQSITIDADVGVSAGTLAAGDDGRFPSLPQKQALDASVSPGALNRYITASELPPASADNRVGVSAADATPSTLDEKLSHGTGLTSSVIAGPSGGQVEVLVDFGTTAGTVVAGNDVRIPTQPQKDAMDAALAPSATNKFITEDDLTAIGAGATTGLNVGGGAGVFRAKVGNDLQLRSITPLSSKLFVAVSVDLNEVEIDVVESNILHQSLSGAGTLTHAQIDAQIASPTQKAAMDAASSPSAINPFATLSDLPADSTTASNEGAGGFGLFITKTGDNLEFRNINAAPGGKVSVALDAPNNEVDIDVDESNIVHDLLSGAGANSHAQIDAHIADASIHFPLASLDPTVISVILPAAGTGGTAARDDHVHGVSTAAPTIDLDIGAAPSEGTATS